jgi:hypothetical protein
VLTFWKENSVPSTDGTKDKKITEISNEVSVLDAFEANYKGRTILLSFQTFQTFLTNLETVLTNLETVLTMSYVKRHFFCLVF